jgi:TldD protein
MLTIHESVAHPTGLDRALGYEANYAGTSYITPDKIGNRIASEHCTFVGERIAPRALATCGYDDDGVKTTSFTIIAKRIFRNYQTTREQAYLVDDKEGPGRSDTFGCSLMAAAVTRSISSDITSNSEAMHSRKSRAARRGI